MRIKVIDICMRSCLVVTIVSKGMHIATESALEDILRLYLHSLWTFADLVSDLGAIITNIVLRVILGELLKELFGSLEVLLHKDFGMIVRTLGTFLAESIHVVPAELADDVLEFASLPVEAKTHVKVRATLVNMAEGTVFSFFTFFSHEIRTYFEVVTEVALVSISTGSHALEFVARLDFAFVVRVWAVVRQPALAMNEFLTDSICGKFVVVGCGDWLFSSDRSIVQRIIVPRISGLLLVWVHL